MEVALWDNRNYRIKLLFRSPGGIKLAPHRPTPLRGRPIVDSVIRKLENLLRNNENRSNAILTGKRCGVIKPTGKCLSPLLGRVYYDLPF